MTKNKPKGWVTGYFFNLWIWLGKKLGFTFVDVYAPNKKRVVAITFSTSKKYLYKITKIK
jgi:hypothetical protein